MSMLCNLPTSFTVTQIAMGTFVSYFFSGFILGKIPFPLSPSFRLMLQVCPLSEKGCLCEHFQRVCSRCHFLTFKHLKYAVFLQCYAHPFVTDCVA